MHPRDELLSLVPDGETVTRALAAGPVEGDAQTVRRLLSVVP
jgi:hypothetical protein